MENLANNNNNDINNDVTNENKMKIDEEFIGNNNNNKYDSNGEVRIFYIFYFFI